MSYFNRPEHSRSSLALLLESPYKYYLQYVDKSWKVEETPAMRLGTAIHTAVLEPEKFFELYCLNVEGISLATKEGKALKALAEEQGKTLLSASDSEAAINMQSAIKNHETARMLLITAAIQHEAEFYGEIMGHACRARMDVIGQNYVADLKTIASAEKHSIANAIHAHNLDLQAWMYLELAGVDSFFFVFIEKAFPHLIRTYEISDEWLFQGEQKFLKATKILKQCEESGQWPHFLEDEEELYIPVPKYLTY